MAVFSWDVFSCSREGEFEHGDFTKLDNGFYAILGSVFGSSMTTVVYVRIKYDATIRKKEDSGRLIRSLF